MSTLYYLLMFRELKFPLYFIHNMGSNHRTVLFIIALGTIATDDDSGVLKSVLSYISNTGR